MSKIRETCHFLPSARNNLTICLFLLALNAFIFVLKAKHLRKSSISFTFARKNDKLFFWGGGCKSCPSLENFLVAPMASIATYFAGKRSV